MRRLKTMLALVLPSAISPAVARAQTVPTYTLVDGQIVVRARDETSHAVVPCEETHALREREGRLYVACGDQGVAVFRVANDRPVFASRLVGRGCTALSAEGSCASDATIPAEPTPSPPADDSPGRDRPPLRARRTPDMPPRRPERTWYGRQTLLADWIALGSMVLPPLGIVAYCAGPPAVHFAHGNNGAGAASIAMRVLALGGVAGLTVAALASAASHAQDLDASAALVALAIGAYLTPPVVDAAALAYEERAPKHGFRAAPWLAVRGDGAAAGVGGSF